MSTRRSPDILVVEDSDEDYIATVRALRASGRPFQPHRCASAAETLGYLYRQGPFADANRAPRPRLILLDLNLPGTDGRDLLISIRSDQRLRDIPVIVLTTSADPEDIAECYRNGANSYQHKPVDYLGFKASMCSLAEYWFATALLPAE